MPAVVAEEQLAVGERRAALDRAARLVGPDHAAVVGVEAVELARLRSEVDPPAVQQRRGLAAARQRPRPAALAVALAQRDDPSAARAPAALEQSHIDPAVAERGRGRRQAPELALPAHLAVLLAQRAQLAVVGELEQRVARHHGRELEQRGGLALPDRYERAAERRRWREEAPVVLRVAVVAPDEGVRPWLRRGLRAPGLRRVGRPQRRLRGRRTVLGRKVGDIGGHRDPRPHEDRRSGRSDHDDAAAHRSRVERAQVGTAAARPSGRAAASAPGAPSRSTRRSAAAIASSVQASGSSRNAA